MFKIIKNELYDEFQCWMDKCPANCCDENWIISIDDATYEKYKEMNVEDLDQKISPETKTIIKHNGKCPFILENGLCYLHKNLGEDYLSNTCKSYPRFISTYGDVFVNNIGLSCPAAADWIVKLDHKCDILEKVYYEQESEVGKQMEKMQIEEVMNYFLSFFYQNDRLIDALTLSFSLVDENKELSCFDNDFFKDNELVFINICICYLFEHIMLESKKDKIDFFSVLDRLCGILLQIEKEYGIQNDLQGNNELTPLARAIYITMRNMDHVV